jgi:HJR/Mrr/RecB family endonuclease
MSKGGGVLESIFSILTLIFIPLLFIWEYILYILAALIAISVIGFIVYKLLKKRDLAISNKKREEKLRQKEEEERKLKELEAKQEEERRLKELEAKQEEERKLKELEAKEEEERRLKELEAKQEEVRKLKELEAKQEEERRQKELLRRIEERREREIAEERRRIAEEERNLSFKLMSLGAEYKLEDNKVYITGKDDVDLLELLYYGKLLNSIVKGKRPITYEIFDRENKLITNILYEEIETKTGLCFVCNIRFAEGAPAIVIKKEFFSDCCYITKAYTYCYIQNRKIKNEEKEWERIIDSGVENINDIKPTATNVEEYVLDILNQSNYYSLFAKEIDVVHKNQSIVINYKLPNKEDFLTIKEYKYNVKSNEITSKLYPENYVAKAYETALYSICLRSIYETYYLTQEDSVNRVTFNGYINHINRSVGKMESKYIVSLSVTREQYNNLEIRGIDPKLCFKSLKGVSASKLADIVAITPIINFDKNDKRFIENKNVDLSPRTNLAAIEWTEFEQLVRELFELEFSKVGGEVKVTQTSRDGGIDAIIYDPDPLRGGKIVVQAKRYTNTVGVSAVRDLYGTVINEGANAGILITTSDYGNDSYEFAQNKPLKLLNGGHLLGLLEKHGRQAYINIKEAKEFINNSQHR